MYAADLINLSISSSLRSHVGESLTLENFVGGDGLGDERSKGNFLKTKYTIKLIKSTDIL